MKEVGKAIRTEATCNVHPSAQNAWVLYLCERCLPLTALIAEAASVSLVPSRTIVYAPN